MTIGPHPRLHFQSTRAIEGSAIVHEGSFVAASDTKTIENVNASYVLTPGPGVDASFAGLCPGDSGGPLYRNLGDPTSAATIAGVNSNYTFMPYPKDGKPITNWHTRVSDGSRWNVGAWLGGLGAETTRTR